MENVKKIVLEKDLFFQEAFNLKKKLKDCLKEKINLEIDLKYINFIDTNAIDIFVSTAIELNKSNKRLILKNAKRHVKEVLELINLHRIAELYDEND